VRLRERAAVHVGVLVRCDTCRARTLPTGADAAADRRRATNGG